MRIDKSEVDKVAKLARLEITEGEKEVFAEQLSSILDYVEQLKAWDTTGLEPTATVVGQTNVFREDQVRPSLSADQVLANAPEQEGGFFSVPKIIQDT